MTPNTQLSNCCQSTYQVRGNTTKYNTCDSCGKACNLESPNTHTKEELAKAVIESESGKITVELIEQSDDDLVILTTAGKIKLLLEEVRS